MLKGNANDIVLREIRGNRGSSRHRHGMLHQPRRWVISEVARNETTRSNVTHLLTMSGHPIFIRIDRDCVHRKLVGRAEDTDGNFLETDEMECYAQTPSS